MSTKKPLNKKNNNGEVFISLRINKDLKKELKTFCKNKGITLKHLATKGLKDFMDRNTTTSFIKTNDKESVIIHGEFQDYNLPEGLQKKIVAVHAKEGSFPLEVLKNTPGGIPAQADLSNCVVELYSSKDKYDLIYDYRFIGYVIDRVKGSKTLVVLVISGGR